MCAISSLTSTFAISSPDEFLFREHDIRGRARVATDEARVLRGR